MWRWPNVQLKRNREQFSHHLSIHVTRFLHATINHKMMKSSLILAFSRPVCVVCESCRQQEVKTSCGEFFTFFLFDTLDWRGERRGKLLFFLAQVKYRWNWEIVSRCCCWLRVSHTTTTKKLRVEVDGIIEIKKLWHVCVSIYDREREREILQFMRLSSSMFTPKTLNVCKKASSWLNYSLVFTAHTLKSELRFIAIVNWCQHHN